MTDDKIIQGTLDWCNEQRAKKGLCPLASLPRGKRTDPISCPCGEATGRWVTSEYCYALADLGPVLGPDYDTKEPIPWAVSEFVRLFDNGWFPQFDLEA